MRSADAIAAELASASLNSATAAKCPSVASRPHLLTTNLARYDLTRSVLIGRLRRGCACSKLRPPPAKTHVEPPMHQIADRLEKPRHVRVARRIAENGINIAALRSLTDQDLRDIAVLLGHLRDISCRAIGALWCASAESPTQATSGRSRPGRIALIRVPANRDNRLVALRPRTDPLSSSLLPSCLPVQPDRGRYSAASAVSPCCRPHRSCSCNRASHRAL